MSLYEIEVKDAQQNLTTLEAYRGKVLLIVNTATGCGFTPQYEGLETLYRQHKDKGFEVLDFPCNQFGNQAPGTQADIDAFCSLNYNTTFPRFAKVDVNGDAASPLFTYLKKQKGSLLGSAIKWNFTKFLIDRQGNVIGRYEPTVIPAKIEKDILNALAG
jgi:glutathione peroxidase